MNRRLRLRCVSQTCVSWAAIVLIAVSSVLFAAHKAPDAQATAIVATYQAMGVTADDLCGDGPTPDHDHCPFCRLLAEASPVKPGVRVFRLSPQTDLASLADQVSAPLGGSPAIRSRAPPRIG